MKFDILISDASFDYKTKTAVIGVKSIFEGIEYQETYQAKNVFDAEYYGMEKAIIIAHKKKINNILLFCDNKGVVNKFKKDFFKTEEMRAMFWYAQFIWLPREYTSSADFLTRFFSDKDIETYNKQKQEHYENQLENKVKINILDIKINREPEILKQRVYQFSLLTEECKFKSLFFQKTQMNIIPNDEDFLDIENIEYDLYSIEDDVIKIIAENLFKIYLEK